jgi:hypothetical protein
MARELIWVEGQPRFLGWGCSGCAWEFSPLVVPTGTTINEIAQKYEQQRDEEFEAHVCTKYPRRPTKQ